jgi:phosphoribosylformylglycinamidine cyclo-ligase
MAHITGGGLYENVPRIIPDGLCASIDTTKIESLPIFDLIEKLGVAREEMFGTFNMGVGFILVVNPQLVDDIIKVLAEHGEKARVIGTITQGNDKICLN